MADTPEWGVVDLHAQTQDARERFGDQSMEALEAALAEFKASLPRGQKACIEPKWRLLTSEEAGRLGTIDREELENRFAYHALKEGQLERYQGIRDVAFGLAAVILEGTPASREQSLALTHLEQAVMWANAAIARRE